MAVAYRPPMALSPAVQLKEFGPCFNELFPTSPKEDQHANDPQNHTHTANPVSGAVDTLNHMRLGIACMSG